MEAIINSLIHIFIFNNDTVHVMIKENSSAKILLINVSEKLGFVL